MGLLMCKDAEGGFYFYFDSLKRNVRLLDVWGRFDLFCIETWFLNFGLLYISFEKYKMQKYIVKMSK